MTITALAPPDTSALRENATCLPDDVFAQRLTMLADYLERSGRHYQYAYVWPSPNWAEKSVRRMYRDRTVHACAAGMAVLMFADPDAEITAAGGVICCMGSVTGTDRKAAALLGLSMECARSLFAGCAPASGVRAMLRKLAQGENMGPVDWSE